MTQKTIAMFAFRRATEKDNCIPINMASCELLSALLYGEHALNTLLVPS